MLAFAALLPPPVARAEEIPTSDIYSLTVEFGSLSFYYDHGIWDPNLMNYVASTTDDTYANGTTKGYPGWYGFDGTANKITVTNSSYAPMTIHVSLTYKPLSEGTVISGVSMKVEDGGGSAAWTGTTNSYNTALTKSQHAVALIHLQGMPKLSNGDRYISENAMAPIGMLELKIESPN